MIGDSLMKSIIVYYSVSGNTRKIAKAIHKGMRLFVNQCDLVSIKGSSGIPGMTTKDLLKYDLIGFGSPVWDLLPTKNVMTFIKSLPSLKGKHTFAFFTHGVNPAAAPRWAAKALRDKHATVVGWNDWYGSCVTADLFKPYFTDGHPDEIDLKEAEDWGREIVERSRRISEGETDLIPIMPKGKEYNERYGYRFPWYNKWAHDNHYLEIKRIDMEKCNQCNLCVENCPTGSINLKITPPVDKSTCIFCQTCEQICPMGAIEVDWESIAAKHDKDWGKNWHELKFLKKAQIRTQRDPRFRALVPLEDVGKDGHWYQIAKKHPRIKIPK
jgi:ferredoxin/flavodoxin